MITMYKYYHNLPVKPRYISRNSSGLEMAQALTVRIVSRIIVHRAFVVIKCPLHALKRFCRASV